MAGTFDAVVIGAGIAGLAVASELARERSVLVVEMEPAYASHSTARSAASWIAGYGRPAVKPFTLASRRWFETGGDGHLDGSQLARRGLLLAASTPDASSLLPALASGARGLAVDEARALIPALRTGRITGLAYEPDTHDIDVSAAVEAFRAALRLRTGELRTSARVTAIARRATTWRLETESGPLDCDLVVNAAGAWSDTVASMASLPTLGLQPFRRTACTFAAPAGHDVATWPLLMDADERFYLKPEAGGLLASPADETPQAPGDARAATEDVALALERVREATTLDPRSVRSTWAGLRTFAPDRAPVLGPDPIVPGFAWFAGLGGYGIMTAPAAARSVVSLIDRGALPADVVELGGSAAEVLPDRLRT